MPPLLPPYYYNNLSFFLFLFSISNYSQSNSLSEASKVSIITCGTGNESYSLYGHTGIRIKDSLKGIDIVYNYGAFDFQTKNVDGEELYKVVIETSKRWKNSQNLMYVIGATKADYFTEIRKLIPESFLLVPGVGAQGGSLQEVCKYGMNDTIGLLINSSRAIIYASSGEDFAQKAREEALKMQQEMEMILRIFNS